MAKNAKHSPKKLGQSTNVKIGGKQYSSYDMPNLKQQTKEVHTVTDRENAPRDISKKLVNQENTIKTNNTKSLTESSGKINTATSPKPTNSTGTTSVSSGGGTTINSTKTKINTSKNIIMSSEAENQAIKSVQSTITKVKNMMQNSLDTQDDSGASTLSNALSTGVVTVKVIKTAQEVSPYFVKSSVGIYSVADKSVKVVKRVDATVGMIKTGAIQLNKDTVYRLKNMAINQLKQTRTAQTLIHAVTSVKTSVDTAKHYSLTIGYGMKRAVILTKGVALGTVKIQINKETLKNMRNAIIHGTIKGANVVENAIGYKVKTGVVCSVKTGIKVGKGFNKGLLRTSDMLTNTADMGTQALGYGLKTTHYVVKGISYTPRLAKATYKGVKTGINTMVKTGRFVGKSYRSVKTGIKIITKVGSNKALKMYANRWSKSLRGKTTKVLAKAGNSVVTAVFESIKKLGMKIVLPLILILLVVMCGSNVVSSFASAIANIFSPFVSDDSGAEVDESAWLTSHITTKRKDLIHDIKDTYNDNLVANGGDYHYVRFFNVFSDAEVELTDTNINTSIYTVSEYQQSIQPIFHTLIMSEYNMEASESEMQSVLDDLWDKISLIKTEELPKEYCNAGATERDGKIHADISTCPNYSDIQYHADKTDSTLCSCDHWYYACDGHKGSLSCDESEEIKHTHTDWKSASDSGCYSTNYHSGELTSNCGNSTKHKGCNGYYVCKGHKILSLTVKLGNFNDLLNDYYLTEINSLEAQECRTADEEQRLQELNDYYEICINYMAVLEQELGYGDGGEVVDLSGVTLTDVTDFACQFVGNPYVYGGDDINNGIDCSAFVRYVYAHFGVNLPRTSRGQVTCGTTILSISDAQAGDLIFWSGNGTDSDVYHVAMYLGNGKMVHASNPKPYPVGGIKISNLYGTLHKIKRIAN